jgi:hypothetical protein
MSQSLRVFGYSDKSNPYLAGYQLVYYSHSSFWELGVNSSAQIKDAVLSWCSRLSKLRRCSAAVAGQSCVDLVPAYESQNANMLRLVARAVVVAKEVWSPAMPNELEDAVVRKFPVSDDTIGWCVSGVHGYSPGWLIGDANAASFSINLLAKIRLSRSFGEFYNRGADDVYGDSNS